MGVLQVFQGVPGVPHVSPWNMEHYQKRKIIQISIDIASKMMASYILRCANVVQMSKIKIPIH